MFGGSLYFLHSVGQFCGFFSLIVRQVVICLSPLSSV